MKMSINKLIANDIINYGMSKTSGFDYSVYLDSYIDDFDDKSKQYILDNLEDICKDISANENLSYFTYNKDSKEFDMVFYWDNLLDAVDKYVCGILKDKNLEDKFELDDIREISEELINDESLKNLTIEKIRNCKCMEID